MSAYSLDNPYSSILGELRVVSRVFEVMSKQKSKKERNIQTFRSEAHQITRKGYEG